MGRSFTAFDFETANQQGYSACQLGIAVVENEQITLQKSWLIKPPTKVFTFSDLHGITYKMVKDSPAFCDIWQEVRPYLEGQIVAAHNAEFDLNVLQETLAYYQLATPELYFIDSLAVARSAWPKLRNHRLSTVADYLNIGLNHHEALSDAIACAEIVLQAGLEHSEIQRAAGRDIVVGMDLFGGEY